jgi:hypothetical protein
LGLFALAARSAVVATFGCSALGAEWRNSLRWVSPAAGLFFFGEILMGEHNRGMRQHPRTNEAKERRVLALLDGKEIFAPRDFVASDSHQGERKFHIGNLSYDATEADLREFVSSVGHVVECHLFLDSFNGRSRGFAVLRICGNAFELDGVMFHGRELRIDSWDRE